MPFSRSDGLKARDARVVAFFRGRGLPVVSVMGGGYPSEVDHVARRHLITFEAAAEFA